MERGRVMRPTLDELCAAHRNEERHTRHVTALALRIFDATRAWLKLRAADRGLLEAAARLHDIGYAAAPQDHVARGAEIVLRARPRGLPRDRLDLVTGILLLHSSRLDRVAGHPHLARVRDPARVHRLGAILRVADALDHSHLQDARITRIAREGGMVRLGVSIAPRLGHIERAMAKSDLWQRTFALGLVFRATERRGYRLLAERDDAFEAVRKLLLVQYRALNDSVRRAARSDDEEALHDLRIALRCVRRLLEAFARLLRDTTAERVDRRLRDLAKALGPARDLDVWIALLARPGVRRSAAGDPHWAAFVEHQQRERENAQRAVRALLGRPRARKLLSRLGYLLRVELHERAGTSGRSFGAYARRQVRRAFKAMVREQALAASNRAEALHELRIAIRKARLLADLLLPVLGPGAGFLILRLRRVERRLGRIHDLDVALDRAKALGRRCPAALGSVLRKRRRKQVRAFRREWDLLTAPAALARCARAWAEP